MIQAISKYFTNKIFLYNYNSEDYEIHQYGIEVIVSTCINILFLIIVGILTHHTIDSLLYFIFFYIIRKFSGGFHCQHYYSCISLHICLFFIYTYIPDIFYRNAILVFSFSFLTFIFFSPYNMRTIANNETKKYKYISISMLILYAAIYYIFHLNIMLYIIFIVSILLILPHLVSWNL